MSSTNKTPNYNLSQFTADDKPAWLGDYNSDMQKIDAQMKSNATKADSAEKTANNANTASSTALETATEAKTLASGASTNASTALSTAQSANQTAQNASQNAQTAKDTANTASGIASSANSNAQNANTNANKALQEINKFNLVNSQTIAASGIIGQTNVGRIVNAGINIISDSTNKVFKLYGMIEVTINEGGQVKVTAQSNLRPSKKITIPIAGIALYNNLNSTDITNFSIETNGLITFDSWADPSKLGDKYFRFYFFNMLYILDAFEQVIVNPNE